MAAEFDVKDVSGIAETEAVDGDVKMKTGSEVAKLIYSSRSSFSFWRSTPSLQLTTSRNTAVYRCRGISATVHYRRTFLDSAHN